MKNELLHIGNFTIYGYGLMIALGILAAFWFIDYRSKKKGLDPDAIFWMTIWTVIGGFVGAKLLFYITRLDEIIKDIHVLTDNFQNGWVVYGGIIGGVITCWIYCHIKKIRFSQYLDLAVPAVALAQAFGRMGCFLAGCCYGIETTSHFSITFTESAYCPNNVALFPAQPVSAALNLIHFGILLFAATKFKKHGQSIGLYLTLYSIGRFIIEFFRGDLERGQVGVLSTSQFISIFVVVLGVALMYFGCEFLDSKAAIAKEKAGTENAPAAKPADEKTESTEEKAEDTEKAESTEEKEKE